MGRWQVCKGMTLIQGLAALRSLPPFLGRCTLLSVRPDSKREQV